MLDNACLMEKGNQLSPEKFIFQQVNAIVHTAKTSMEYFEAMGIEILPWPARSPESIQLRMFWDGFLNQIYKEGNQFDTVIGLKRAILSAWEKLPVEYLAKLISSLKNRIFEAINKNGGVTHY